MRHNRCLQICDSKIRVFFKTRWTVRASFLLEGSGEVVSRKEWEGRRGIHISSLEIVSLNKPLVDITKKDLVIPCIPSF